MTAQDVQWVHSKYNQDSFHNHDSYYSVADLLMVLPHALAKTMLFYPTQPSWQMKKTTNHPGQNLR